MNALPTGEVVSRIDELLEVTYRSGDLGNVSDVLSETIYILLSLNAREKAYQRVYRTLREVFPRWVDVENANVDRLSAVLQPGGLQGQRATYLKALLQRVREDNVARSTDLDEGRDGDLTLEYLRDMQDADVEAFLLSLPGVGKKTARCVMSYALDRDQFAVDTHVREDPDAPRAGPAEGNEDRPRRVPSARASPDAQAPPHQPRSPRPRRFRARSPSAANACWFPSALGVANKLQPRTRVQPQSTCSQGRADSDMASDQRAGESRLPSSLIRMLRRPTGQTIRGLR